MSDHGEKTCPLCAEEMDLTDQQLKPCRCGYEICVWCWHHIMDMAEKDESEGRCPACRSPYDKEKIVGTAAKCERLVAEISMERKVKPQKTKAKPSEGRKQLSSVRVIQRNLVYIVGLPLNLGDEDLLQRKEYFGQYGKVLKVSMSRTAAGIVQQFPNNTCSLYITYSKDEEAIRCIQSVHAFVLDGRSLKACFGTTKYCHAWLRNMPCSNLDCLYLHEIGLQEDSYTKDEIISAYSSVPQITGAISNLQRRAGTVLPPPVDLCIISSASSEKNLLKNGANNSVSIPKGSPPNSSSGRSTALPAGASWGTRGSNVQALTANAAPLNGLLMKKGELTSAPVDFSLAVTSNVQDSNLHNDAGKKVVINEDRIPQATKKLDSSSESHRGSYTPMSASEKIIKVEGTPPVVFSSASQDKLGDSTLSPQIRKSVGLIGTFQPTDEQKDANDYEIEEMCSDMSSVDIARNLNKEPAVDRPHHYPSEHILDGLSRDWKIQPDYVQQPGDAFTSAADRKSTTSNDGIFSALRQDPMSDTHAERLANSCSDADEDVQSFNDQRLYDSKVFDSAYLPNLNDSLHILNNSSGSLLHRGEDRGLRNFNTDTPLVNRNGREDSLVHIPSASIGVNGYPENLHNSIGLDAAAEKSYLFTNEYKRKQMGRSERHAANFDRSALLDMGESSIISNILSMEFDADDSLTTPQNLAKLLNETNKEQSLLRTSNSWRAPNSNQSRFSFARKDGSNDQVYSEHSITNSISQVLKSPFSNSLVDSQDTYLNTCRYGNGFSGNFEELRSSSSQTIGSSSKVSISRAQISAPPGFSVLNRAPPPGFTSHGSVDHSFDPLSGNHLLEASSPLRNLYQDPPMSNFNSTADIEFLDPAILAVGKGIVPGGLNNLGLDVRSNFPSQISAFEEDARLELLMQRSLSQQQNLRYTDTGSGFSHLNDNFSVHRHLIEQSQPNNHSPFEQLTFQQSRNGQISNGHWDVWNDVQRGNNFHAAELLRNERLGFNKLRNGYEDSKFWVPSSGDLYSRNFGM